MLIITLLIRNLTKDNRFNTTKDLSQMIMLLFQTLNTEQLIQIFFKRDAFNVSS